MIEIINGNTYERLSPCLHRIAGYIMLLYCPGCEDAHQISIDHPNNNQAKWGWNGDVEKPTFTPSILVGPRHTNAGFKDIRCHSFIRDGVWDFLGDCTHDLKGQQVPLQPIPREEEGA